MRDAVVAGAVPRSLKRLASWGLTVLLLGVSSSAAALEVSVSTAEELRSAVDTAQPGDVIAVEAGLYSFDKKVMCQNAGEIGAPITIRSVQPLAAQIRFDSVEGFHVRGPNWVFEDLDIGGVCADHSACEHAFHITGAADGTVVRGCNLHDFNAHIKGNGEPIGEGGAYVWPDDVVIEYNELANATPRQTSNPVTPIDVVGGRRWELRGNFIHDHAKAQGNGVSYAAFLKGNSRDGLMERNLVICELNHTGQTRLGLSLGGGGSGPDKICEDSTCTPEHQGGVLRNNIIVNCPADVGIYLNEASGTKIYNNTLYNTTGIDVRFEASTADIRQNLLDGKIRNRDGGTSMQEDNLAQIAKADFEAWFVSPGTADFSLVSGALIVDKGEPLPEVSDDFCAHPRDQGKPDLGPVEYGGSPPCVTTFPFVPEPEPEPEPEPDVGEEEVIEASPEPVPDVADEELIEVSDDAGPTDQEVTGEVAQPKDTGTTAEPASSVEKGPGAAADDSSGCAFGAPTGSASFWMFLVILALVPRRCRERIAKLCVYNLGVSGTWRHNSGSTGLGPP